MQNLSWFQKRSLGRRSLSVIAPPFLAVSAIALAGASLAQQTLDGAAALPGPVVKVEGLTETDLSTTGSDAIITVAQADLDGEPEALVTPDLDAPGEIVVLEGAEPVLTGTEVAEQAVTGTGMAGDAPASEPIDEAILPEPVDYYVPKDGVPEPLVAEASSPVMNASSAQNPGPVAGATLPMVHQPLQSVGMAARQPISVTIDRAKVLRLAAPAETVIIGNPAIVDVTLQDARTLVLTAKGYGTTNLIILDASGQPMADEVVQTRRASASIARIYRGAEQYSYSCTPDCTQTPAVGDYPEHFENAIGQAQTRVGWSNGGDR